MADADLPDVIDPSDPATMPSVMRQMAGVPSPPVWNWRDEREATKYLIDMPGLGRDDVRVIGEGHFLAVEGGPTEAGGRKYSGCFFLPPELYKIGEVKAEMKNGVLKIAVPKVKPQRGEDPSWITVNVE